MTGLYVCGNDLQVPKAEKNMQVSRLGLELPRTSWLCDKNMSTHPAITINRS